MSEAVLEKSPQPDNGLIRALKWLDDNFEKLFLVTGLLAIVFLITWQVIYRYGFTHFTSGGKGADWAEEISRYIFIWISYLAVPVAIRRRDLIRVDIVYDRLPERLQKMSWIIVDMAMLLWSVVVLERGFLHVMKLMAGGTATPVMHIPYWVLYTILPFGFAMITLRIVQDLYKQVKICGAANTMLGLVAGVLLALPALLHLPFSATAYLFGYFLILLVLGVPIAMALGISAIVTILATNTIPIAYVAQLSFNSLDKATLLALPFFIVSGDFMGAGGLSKRLFGFADECLGAAYGGLALATVATCVLFGAMSGSGPATVAAIGALCIPAMVERGYDRAFAAAIVACAGAIGVMIPPSNPFVIYGVTSNASIGNLFMAGIIPGLFVAAVLMFYSYWLARKNDWRGEQKERNAKTKFASFWEAKWAMLVPVIILGGIYGGFMTPTEAAAVAAFYGLIVGVFIHREINGKILIEVLVNSACTSSMIIVLMAMATIFGNIMTIEHIPTTIANFILGVTSNKIAILLIINVLLLIVGTFMEALAAIVILVPLLLPIVTQLGVDPVHFGVIMVLNLAIGFVTPPVGVNLFVASGISKLKIEAIAAKTMPMLGLMLIVLLIVTFLPQISLLLPSLLQK